MAPTFRRWSLRFLLVIAILVIGIPTAFLIAATIREELPAGSSGMHGSYIKADGLDIHYERWGPENGPALILVHGTIAWSKTWAPMAERLAAKGYRVLAADFPPFGYSSRPEDGDYSRTALARRILAFANAMNIQRFTLIGHSFGGGGTIEAAFHDTDRLNGLVLLDPAVRLDNPRPDKPLGWLVDLPTAGKAFIASTFTNSFTTGFGLRSFVKDPAVATDALVALYRQAFEVRGTTEAVRKWYLRGLFGDESNALSADRDNYRRYKLPVLLIWGQDDTVTPLPQGEELHRLLPNSTLAVLPNVNHIPQIETPDQTAALISEFVGKLQ